VIGIKLIATALKVKTLDASDEHPLVEESSPTFF
jgi:hypothetical protein